MTSTNKLRDDPQLHRAIQFFRDIEEKGKAVKPTKKRS